MGVLEVKEAVTDAKEIAQVEKRLTQALEADDFDFGPHLEKAFKKRAVHLAQELDFPTRISIENTVHPTYTLIDIQTPDRLGLLYNLLRAMGRAGAQIALSRIATEKGAAIDTFYVTDLDGRKIKTSTAITRLQSALREASEGVVP